MNLSFFPKSVHENWSYGESGNTPEILTEVLLLLWEVNGKKGRSQYV